MKNVLLLLVLFVYFQQTTFFAQTVYSTPGTYTWIVPPCVNSVTVKVWGAGGGGGGASSYMTSNSAGASYVEACSAGGGGGGGGFAMRTYSVVPGESYTIVVGAGGIAGVAAQSNSAANNGGNGGSSTFSGPATASFGILTGGGGSFGGGALINNNSGGWTQHMGTNGAGGTGGAGANGTTMYNGGTGATGMHSASCWDLSGGGGGGAGDAGIGGNAQALVCYGGQAGGTGGTANGGAGANGRQDAGVSTSTYLGNNGTARGGGGGGGLIHARDWFNAWRKVNGGAGANGYVELLYSSGSPITPSFTSVGPLCQGATAPILPSTSTNGISGTWSPSSVSTASAGTTTYTFTPGVGQCASTTSQNITITASVTPTFASIGPLCLGATSPSLPTTSLNSISGTWSPSSVNTAIIGTTTYSFSPDLGQCANSATQDITINTTVTPTFATVGPLCEGVSAPSLPATSINSISGTWSPSSVNTTNVGTTTYTFTPDAGQCGSVVTQDITVNSTVIPTFTPIGDLCEGVAAPSLPAVSNNGITGLWSPSTLSTIGVGNTTYTFTPDAGFCATTATQNVTVNANISPLFTNVGSLCQGDVAPSLSSTSNNSISGSWSPSTINTSSAGTTTYTFTPSSGQCANSTTQDITVITNITPNFSPIGPFCQGVTAPGLPATSINSISGTWSPSSVNTASAGTTTFTFTPGAGQCATSTNQDILVNPLPLVNAGNDQALCVGMSITLNGSGATSYSWDNGVTDGTSFTPSATTTYSVTGTDGNNCTNTDQVTVTVNALPTITASAAPASICQGQTTVLTGNGGTTYTWDNGIGTGNNLNASPASTTTYNVSGTDANGCVNTAQVSVTVNPNIPVNAGLDQVVCAGQQVTLTASGTPTNTWNNGVTNGVAFTPASSTTYTVTGTSANGCITTDQVTVTVNPLPTINAGSDQTVCVGQSVTLNGSNGQTYSWDNGVSNGTSFTANATTTYTVTGTDANGCVDTDQVTVTVLPVPNADLSSDVTSGGVPLTVTFYNGSIDATTYTWNFGTGLPVNSTSTNDQVFTYGNPGTYSVILTASNGYCADTAMLQITVFPAAPPKVTPPNIFTPNGDGSNDNYFISYENLSNIEVVIMNRWGNFMYEYKTLNGFWDGKIAGKEAVEGVYFYKYKAIGTNGEELKGHGFFHLER